MVGELALPGIALISLAAAAVNAAFATGGIYILIAFTASVLPISVAIPLLPLLAGGSLLGRCVYFRAHIRWPMALMFSAGAIVGAFLGVRLFVELPELLIGTLLGVLLLLLIWCPLPSWRMPVRHPYFLVGVAHTFVSSLVGAGAVLQSVLIRSPLNKLEVTATLAACTAIMEVFKVSGYWVYGFSYSAYLPHILTATVMGLLGTWLGGHLAHRIPERYFRPVFKLIISVVALRLLWQAWI